MWGAVRPGTWTTDPAGVWEGLWGLLPSWSRLLKTHFPLEEPQLSLSYLTVSWRRQIIVKGKGH